MSEKGKGKPVTKYVSEKGKPSRYKPGTSGNPSGRTKGSVGKITKIGRDTIALALQGNVDEISSALQELRASSAKDFIDCIVKLLPYVTPKLLAAQVTEERHHKIEINLSPDTSAMDIKSMLGEDSVEDIEFDDL
tara:strand:+ start:9754 stop:10158 length:405 start_codon:yes stop_codon:yes gene_type:complete